MKIILNDWNSLICTEWEKAFRGIEDVRVICDDFRRLEEIVPNDQKLVMCTAGNSYGVMGGGLDLAVSQRFPGVEEYIRHNIEDIYYGECPVGHSLPVPLEPQQRPFVALLYTPTMRAPIRLYSVENVYTATRAALRVYSKLCAEYVSQFVDSTLIMPGFGGKCGKLHPVKIAAAMRLAYDNHRKVIMPTNAEQMWHENRKIGSCNDV